MRKLKQSQAFVLATRTAFTWKRVHARQMLCLQEATAVKIFRKNFFASGPIGETVSVWKVAHYLV